MTAESVRSPIDGKVIGQVRHTTGREIEGLILSAGHAFETWRAVPGPRRGELVRLLGEQLRQEKEQLASWITLEAGKIVSEAIGEVQEMIDICDFAVGLSRQLHGLTIASERPGHRMAETWHPMGPCAVITAFNFPMAVWAWNAAIALVCGNPVLWKPSDKTPLCAEVVMRSVHRALERFGADAPEGLISLVQGGRGAGEMLASSRQVPLVSATGSTRMGEELGPVVARRFGRSILELGGNNAMIVAPSADLDMAVRAILFSAAGTAGQRCTSLRRLIVHRSIARSLTARLAGLFQSVRVGDPRRSETLVGPLIDEAAAAKMDEALRIAASDGGLIHCGGRVSSNVPEGGAYVRPSLVSMPEQTMIVRQETFAPILYVIEYDRIEEAIFLQNDTAQGLSSSIFTRDLLEAERFLSASGSDCGIANVNIGPSGAEIGGAFGGEKATGGGRESGSDAWKGYMRRQTSTVNYSTALPLAQGVRFDAEEASS
jgi:aldehyde dehydrogenase (NAD+)